MAGHHTGDQPRTPCGGLGAPALSHAPPPPGRHPGPESQRPCRPTRAKTAPPGRRPSGGPGYGQPSCEAGTANAAPSLPVRPDAGRRPRRPRTRGTSTRCARLGRPAHRATPESSAARIARRQRCGHQRPVRPDTWMPRTPGCPGRLDTGRPLDRLDGHPHGGPDEADRATTGLAGVRTPSRPATSRRAVRPRRSRRPGRSTQDGSAVMAPAPRPDRRRHWTAASTARHEAAPRRTALVCWSWRVRGEGNGTTERRGVQGQVGRDC
jgi:hypothetical protein